MKRQQFYQIQPIKQPKYEIILYYHNRLKLTYSDLQRPQSFRGLAPDPSPGRGTPPWIHPVSRADYQNHRPVFSSSNVGNPTI